MDKIIYIKKVMDSCKNSDQADSAYFWINDMYNKEQISKNSFYELLNYLKESQSSI